MGPVMLNGVLQPAYLQLNAGRFCLDVFDAVDKWDSSVENDDAIQAEKAKLLVIHSAGTNIGGFLYG
jgi:hypothetical protein